MILKYVNTLKQSKFSAEKYLHFIFVQEIENIVTPANELCLHINYTNLFFYCRYVVFKIFCFFKQLNLKSDNYKICRKNVTPPSQIANFHQKKVESVFFQVQLNIKFQNNF